MRLYCLGLYTYIEKYKEMHGNVTHKFSIQLGETCLEREYTGIITIYIFNSYLFQNLGSAYYIIT